MRTKDESKKEAVIAATIKLVNEIGFVSASVAKIAKEAGVSPATIYIYFKNKEDLLTSTYISIKEQLSTALFQDFDDTLPIRDTLKDIWHKAFSYISEHPEDFSFTEQFSYSTYSALVNKEEVDKLFEPIFQVLQKGIQQKIIKDVSFEILGVFVFYPVMLLANPRLCAKFQHTKTNIDTAFTLSWDAIKL
ncbi:MAG: TetR/AcrR family transcriptional regulator [bacterium]|nr:TetR/AcrR family transcriptional regulator [bacterium]